MSEIFEPNLLNKMRYTPIRDFLKGRLSARMDLRRALEEAVLPDSVKKLIQRIVRSTRLWRLEQLEVQHELIAHFRDGIAVGSSPEQLMEKFGNEADAARLIRRAKRRNRPIAWHVLRAGAWSLAGVFLFYCGFSIYFFTGRPTPRIDYVADINKEVESTPLEDRAWPLYRQALVNLESVTRKPLMMRSEPGTAAHPPLLQFVSEHQPEIEKIRQGAAKPKFGFLIGAKGSVNDPELWPNHASPRIYPEGESLMSAAIPSLLTLRNMSVLLSADAQLARQTKDGTRLRRDLHSLLGLSQQVGQSGPLLCELISISILETALDQIEATLHESPTLISRAEWTELERRLSAPKVAGDLITGTMERKGFDDLLQRSFTDDGEGNGRLTTQGIQNFITGVPGERPSWAWAFDPVFGMRVASRQTFREEYMRRSNRAIENLKLPMRDTDWFSGPEEFQQSRGISGVGLLSVITPSYSHVQTTAERLLGRRDGVIVGIALENFRQQNGKYPQGLKELVPQFLTEVPADRITGQAVSYRIAGERPLVYSVGVDRKDDEGQLPVERLATANWNFKAENLPKGDWRLYPVVN